MNTTYHKMDTKERDAIIASLTGCLKGDENISFPNHFGGEETLRQVVIEGIGLAVQT